MKGNHLTTTERKFVKNKYTCDKCTKIIITIDIDEGMTPNVLSCKSSLECEGFMWSSHYSPASVGDAEPTHEWYRPTRAQRRSGNQAYRDYYKRGGLALREVPKDDN